MYETAALTAVLMAVPMEPRTVAYSDLCKADRTAVQMGIVKELWMVLHVAV